MTITNQEMFDRAVRGLQSQGFVRCMVSGGERIAGVGGPRCAYVNKDPNGAVIHCAWGWVDPALPDIPGVGVRELAVSAQVQGVARELAVNQFDFASSLQAAHDLSSTPIAMKENLRELAENYKLIIPSDVQLSE